MVPLINRQIGGDLEAVKHMDQDRFSTTSLDLLEIKVGTGNQNHKDCRYYTSQYSMVIIYDHDEPRKMVKKGKSDYVVSCNLRNNHGYMFLYWYLQSLMMFYFIWKPSLYAVIIIEYNQMAMEVFTLPEKADKMKDIERMMIQEYRRRYTYMYTQYLCKVRINIRNTAYKKDIMKFIHHVYKCIA